MSACFSSGPGTNSALSGSQDGDSSREAEGAPPAAHSEERGTPGGRRKSPSGTNPCREAASKASGEPPGVPGGSADAKARGPLGKGEER